MSASTTQLVRLSLKQSLTSFRLVPSLLLMLSPTLYAAQNQVLQVNSDNASAQIESVSSQQAEQVRLQTLIKNQAPAYQDKVMSAPELLDLAAQEPEPVVDGFQAYSLETRVDYSRYETSGSSLARQQGTVGLKAEYLYETLNYGDLKLQLQGSQQAKEDTTNGTLKFETDGTDSSMTLINNNLALTPEVFADSELGDISSEQTAALRRSTQLSLGSSQLRGARTRIQSENFDLRLGSGDLGDLRGSPFAGYQKTDGRLSWLGGSYQLNPNWLIGAQLAQADSYKLETENTLQISSAALAINYEDESNSSKKLRLTALKSQKEQRDHVLEDAQGLSIDGSLQWGRYLHEFGAYKTEPNLYFGDNLLASDQQGSYWRFQRQGSRFNFGAGLNVNQAQTEQDLASSTRVDIDANFRYQWDRDHSYGGSVRAQQSSYDNPQSDKQRSVYTNVYYQLLNTDWGRSRFNLTLHRNEKIVSNDVAATGDEFQWEQDWLGNAESTLVAKPEFITNLGLAHDRSAGVTLTYPTAGLNLRYWPNSDWNVSGSLQYSASSGKLSTSQGLAGSVSSEYNLTSELLVGASLRLNQAEVEVDKQGINQAQTLRSTDKSAQIYLRWNGSRGQAHQVMGKRTAGLAGSGSTSGMVFFDKNQDGIRQADEVGVPEVEIYLDGSFPVRTDKNGYFEFVRVATGQHELAINIDSVPLPWAVKQEHYSVDVPLRGQAKADLALIKE